MWKRGEKYERYYYLKYFSMWILTELCVYILFSYSAIKSVIVNHVLIFFKFARWAQQTALSQVAPPSQSTRILKRLKGLVPVGSPHNFNPSSNQHPRSVGDLGPTASLFTRHQVSLKHLDQLFTSSALENWIMSFCLRYLFIHSFLPSSFLTSQ